MQVDHKQGQQESIVSNG